MAKLDSTGQVTNNKIGWEDYIYFELHSNLSLPDNLLGDGGSRSEKD